MNLLRNLLTFSAMTAASMILAADPTSLQDIPLKDINGKDTSLKAYKGKVVLLVNVASKCGLTPQYEKLEALYRRFKDRGFVIVGVPCNDFGQQEPGTAEEIKTFCSTKYDVTFPLLAKLHVKGAEQHALYTALTGKDAKFPGDIEWNFGKFLIGRNGEVLERFRPQMTPEDATLIAAIEKALKAKP
jgi:glutathione peroxidase